MAGVRQQGEFSEGFLHLRSRLGHAVSLGCALGCAAALATALSDYGAQWLWLERASERLLLLVRLLGFQLPVGALLGAALGALYGLTHSADPVRDGSPARDRLRAVLAGAVLAPGALHVAHALFQGGRMSQLSNQGALQAGVGAVLVVGTALAVYAGLRLFRRTSASAAASVGVGALLVLLGFALGKLDQWAYPKLYEYLHAALTMACWSCFLTGLLFLLRVSGPVWLPRAGLPLAMTGAGLLLFNLWDLDRNQNVRVALLEVRASHSRSLMQGLQPLMLAQRDATAMEHARERAREARARRSAQGADAAPVAPDAHVLLITIDALRADHLGIHGYSRPTSPEIDRIAAGGVAFDYAYAPAPHSSYSLSSLMTSEYLHETLDLGQALPEHTLASTLADAGYHTAAFFTDGIFHTAAERLTRFEHDGFGFGYRDHLARPAEALTDTVLQEVDRTVARGEPGSLFWVHYFDVHEPYEADHFGSSPKDRYDSEIRRVDAAVGRLVREVRARLKRDVIVAITSDHGEEFREHGGLYHGSSLYDEQVRVPLILQGPGLPAARVAAPVETLGLAPTLLAWLGIPTPASMRGDDLRGLALGREREPSPVFSAVIHKKMVVRWPLKLIADLRFNLFELYDLERDPMERNNLADRRPADLEELRGEVYAWIDSLAPRADSPDDAWHLALDRGRLGDRRAVPQLAALLLDPRAPEESRMEGARILGHLRDNRGRESLAEGMACEPPTVGAEAAIALGRMYDARARDALRKLVRASSQDVRTRAAVSLGRLRDREAVPALIEALGAAASDYDREEAVRWLGRLRDPRAVDPLVAHLTDTRRRHLTPIALGLIGDVRAYGPLVHLTRWAKQDGVRDNAIRGLGLLGDERALETLVPLAGTGEHALKNLGESLVRLDALGSGAIGGADVVRGDRGLRGFGACWVGPHLHDWDYLHRTYCETQRPRTSVELTVPPTVTEAPRGSTILLSVRRKDAATPAALHLRLGNLELDPVEVDGSWTELRWSLGAETLASGRVRAELETPEPEARFLIDHLLVIPNTQLQLAAADAL